jgi:maleate isomerase
MDSRPQIDVALIVPHSNTVMEPDFHRMGGDVFDVRTWRIQLDAVTREAEERMLGQTLDTRLEEVAPTQPSLVVFGCTSAGALGGLDHDARVAQRITDATAAPVVTVVGSMVEQLAALSASRVAVFTPYVDDLTRSISACVREAGYEVALERGVGLVDNEEIGSMEPDWIVDFVTGELGKSGADVDAVFLSCTNWRATEALDAASAALGVPVLSSNQVTYASLASLSAR